MLHLLYYALGILVLHPRDTFSNPATYDQRQTGDLNVQIHLKDVEVVALLDSELLDDYTVTVPIITRLQPIIYLSRDSSHYHYYYQHF